MNYPALWVYTPKLPGEPPIRHDHCRWASYGYRGLRQCERVCKVLRDGVPLCPAHGEAWEARQAARTIQERIGTNPQINPAVRSAISPWPRSTS